MSEDYVALGDRARAEREAGIQFLQEYIRKAIEEAARRAACDGDLVFSAWRWNLAPAGYERFAVDAMRRFRQENNLAGLALHIERGTLYGTFVQQF